MVTCTGVSFFHGSNDGAKGMGLMLLILIGILPATYALNMDSTKDDIHQLQQTAITMQPWFDKNAASAKVADDTASPAELSAYIKSWRQAHQPDVRCHGCGECETRRRSCGQGSS